MKLVARTFVNIEDYEAFSATGITINTYLIGTFLQDLIEANQEEVANRLSIRDFEIVEITPDSKHWKAFNVKLINQTDDTVLTLFKALREDDGVTVE